MTADMITTALSELERARTNVQRTANRQIRNAEERAALRALAFAWFQSHRPAVLSTAEPSLLATINAAYQVILDATEKNSVKKTYLDAMTAAKDRLLKLRAHLIVAEGGSTKDTVPDFSPLAGDEVMRGILERRWDECKKCVAARAHLASIVMMGGLLEALFVARANKMTNKSPLFKASTAPIDPKTRKVVDLRDWTLRPYLDVGHELQWITRSAKDVAAVLCEYRNYVHPEKERRHKVLLREQDTVMLWGVTKGLVHQLLQPVK